MLDLGEGTVIVVCWDGTPGIKNGIAFVVVKEVFGAIKGKGWLATTREGNVILVSRPEGEKFCRTQFVLDKESYDQLKAQL